MSLAVILILALAAYRLTRIVTQDTIFSKPRTWLVVKVGRPVKDSPVLCDFCVGWWVSGLVVAAAWWLGWLAGGRNIVLDWPATAGAQALLSLVDRRLQA